MKKIISVALALAAVSMLSLGGCRVSQPDVSTEYNPTSGNLSGETNPPSGSDGTPVRQEYKFTQDVTSLFVYRNGKIESLETDDQFDKDYYDKDELQKDMVDPAINAYNTSQGAKPVSLLSLELKDKVLMMKLGYDTTKDYLAFNKSFNEFFANWNVFTVCKVSDIAANGIDITGAFTDRNGNAISSSKIKEMCGDYYVCAVNFGGSIPSGVSGTFFFEGDIYYLSEGLSIDKTNSISLSATDNIQYIIFY